MIFFTFEYRHLPYFIMLQSVSKARVQCSSGQVEDGVVEPKRGNLNHILDTLIPRILAQRFAWL